MMKDAPILRETKINKTHKVRALGGLHYIKGNSLPYFSLTYEAPNMGGCCHEEILKRWPELRDLASLHLSDINGSPMHATANAWYWLAGTYPDREAFGEKYHGGHNKTPEQCLQIFANHCRIDLSEAETLHKQIEQETMKASNNRNAVAKQACTRHIEPMRPRWKSEADACITRHGLVVFGDEWKGK